MSKFTFTLNKLDKLSGKIRKNLARMIIRDSSDYTPYKTGALEKSASISNDARKIYYSVPYAKFQWYGKLMLGVKSHSAWAHRGERKYMTSKGLNYNRSIHSKAGSEWLRRSIKDNLPKWKNELQDSLRKGQL